MSNELYHYGIKGQQWGRRLYQNKDGSLTAAGKIRYGSNIKNKSISTNTYYFNGSSEPFYENEMYRRTADGKREYQTFSKTKTHTANEKRITLQNDDIQNSNGSHPAMNVSEDTKEKLLNSSYDDLSDNELDTLYKLTDDEKILEYRRKRTAKIIAAGKNYTEKSELRGWLENTLANVVNSADALVKKGKSAVEKLKERIRKSTEPEIKNDVEIVEWKWK